MEILNVWRYFAQVTIDGSVYNDWLYEMPVELRDAALVLGKWLSEYLF